MSLLINVLSFIFVLKYGSLKLPCLCFESNLEMEIPLPIGEGRTSTEGHVAYVDDEIKSILKRPVLFHLGVNGLSSHCVIVSTREREKCNRLRKKNRLHLATVVHRLQKNGYEMHLQKKKILKIDILIFFLF